MGASSISAAWASSCSLAWRAARTVAPPIAYVERLASEPYSNRVTSVSPVTMVTSSAWMPSSWAQIWLSAPQMWLPTGAGCTVRSTEPSSLNLTRALECSR